MSPSSLRRLVLAAAAVGMLCGVGCEPPPGYSIGPRCCTIAGTVQSSRGGPLPGVGVRVTPDGLVPRDVVTTATGNYNATVPEGSGMVALATVPAGCTPPAPVVYAVAGGGAAEIDFTVTCTAP
jgi:hypothetical protein